MMNLFARQARRRLAASMLSLALAGCSVTGEGLRNAELPDPSSQALTHDAPRAAEKFAVDAVDTSHLDPQYVKQVVDYRSTHLPGTVVVDPHKRFLYLVQKGGKAIRYGVGVGRAGLAFAGTGTEQETKEWPRWTPTPAMIAREPKRYARWVGGMEGGTGNPLGARALYLFRNGRDTRYRIHGTTEPDSIGKAVSSGCIRMMNQDVIDLYARVPIGAKVVVL
jgi:lipoprotein-anchoring transpeptidase ErfK/SrfK